MKTIYKALFLTSLLLGTSSIHAQNFEWARSFGSMSLSNDVGRSIALDILGNVYTTGTFKGTVDFNPGAGTVNLTSVGISDVFVLKMDPLGNFLWARSFGGIYDDAGVSIQVDSYGNVITTGIYKGIVDFDPGPGSAALSAANSAVFVHKMNSSGNFVWVRSIVGTTTSPNVINMKLDASGNIYNTGSFQGTVDFDPGGGTLNLNSVGWTDGYVQKLDPSGNLIWAKSFGGSDTDYPLSISIDASGNILTTGTFRATADFDPGSGIANLTSAGEDDFYIQKLDSSGNFIWAKRFGNVFSDESHAITTDISGNIYTTGSFRGTIDFDSGSDTYNLTDVGLWDVFVLKIDGSGNFIWARALGGAESEGALSISVDYVGNVYTKGSFEETVDFNPGAGTYNLTSADDNSLFVQKMDASGNFLWAKAFKCGTNGDPNTMAVDDSGNVYTTGVFEGTVDFDPGSGTYNLTSGGFHDIFILKWSEAVVDGYVFIDTNLNGLKDVGELPIPFQTISYNVANDIAITNENGFFRAFPPVGEQAFNLELPTYYTNTTPLSQTVDVQIGVIDTLYFGIQPISDINDLVVDIHPYESPRPGFTRNYQVSYQNVGTTTLDNVTLKFLKSEEDNFLSATGTYTVSNDTLIWNLGTVEPFSNGSFTITHTLSTSAVLGDYTYTQAWILPSSDDETPDNNAIALEEEIVAAYDPNDKSVTPEVSEPTENEPLEYTIRFQNTGNHQADFVIVKDTLSNLLDLTTFQMIAASHQYEVAIENRIATWTFPQINLPDSTSDEAGSHGFIKFKVQRVDGLGVGTQIPNRVGIYFDYNAPVITNTCIYSIETCISTGTDIITACNNYTWIDGNTYNASNNSATFIIDNAAGCDSIVTLNLTITSPTNAIDMQTACVSYTWIDGNTYTTSNNTAIYIIDNAAGCDSIVTLNLTINTVSNIGTTTNGATITANNNNATYQWLDCNNNNEPIDGATNQTFTATESGNYAVELTENGCTSTSACVAVTVIGIDELSNGLQAAVYPNPSQGNVEITLGSTMQDVELMLTDIQGRVIFTRNYPSLFKTNIELPDAKGVYVLKLKTLDSISTLRLVKE